MGGDPRSNRTRPCQRTVTAYDKHSGAWREGQPLPRQGAHTHTQNHIAPTHPPHTTTPRGHRGHRHAERACEAHPEAWQSIHPLRAWTRGSSARWLGTAPPGSAATANPVAGGRGGGGGNRGRWGGSRHLHTPEALWDTVRYGGAAAAPGESWFAPSHHLSGLGKTILSTRTARLSGARSARGARRVVQHQGETVDHHTALAVERELCSTTLVRQGNSTGDKRAYTSVETFLHLAVYIVCLTCHVIMW